MQTVPGQMSRSRKTSASSAASSGTSCAITREEANSVVRAFSYFSQLANIAEDQHHIRIR